MSGKELSSNQLRAYSIRLAQCLQNYGICEGDVVGICSENRLEFSVALFATIYLGAAFAPLNITYNKRMYIM